MTIFSRVLSTLQPDMSLHSSVCPYFRLSVCMSVRPSALVNESWFRLFPLGQKDENCWRHVFRCALSHEIHTDSKKCVAPLPPVLGFEPLFSFFSNYQQNLRTHKKYIQTKVVGLKKLISGNFGLSTISLQITNLRFFKTFACAENKGMRIILKYSQGGLVGSHGQIIFFSRVLATL